MTVVYGNDAENFTDAVNPMLGADEFPPVEPFMVDEPGIGFIWIIYLAFNALAGTQFGQLSF